MSVREIMRDLGVRALAGQSSADSLSHYTSTLRVDEEGVARGSAAGQPRRPTLVDTPAGRAEAAAAWRKREEAAIKIKRFLRRLVIQNKFWDEYLAEEMEREEEIDWSKRPCGVCGRPCDDDWGWTGHCSRWCAGSYDRRDRHGW